ncbi:hypothetical protein TXIAM_90167 [Tenacibaculum xiamenense]
MLFTISQITIIRNKNIKRKLSFRPRYYWASFVLIGDTNPVFESNVILYISIILIFVVLLFLFLKKRIIKRNDIK